MIILSKTGRRGLNRWIPILATAALGLAAPAYAQLELPWVDAPPGDALTKRLEDDAIGAVARDNRDEGGSRTPPTAHPRTIAFDYFYPTTGREYHALGDNGVLEVSVVAHNPKELPLTKATLRVGMKDVVLQPIAHRDSTVPATSPLAKRVGVNREDAFFLLPGAFSAKTADLWLFFSVPGQAQKAGTLSVGSPDLKPAATPTQPDPSVIRMVLAREYPNLVGP
jgi:hypothetical protein